MAMVGDAFAPALMPSRALGISQVRQTPRVSHCSLTRATRSAGVKGSVCQLAKVMPVRSGSSGRRLSRLQRCTVPSAFSPSTNLPSGEKATVRASVANDATGSTVSVRQTLSVPSAAVPANCRPSGEKARLGV
jgi:hypothetical protein